MLAVFIVFLGDALSLANYTKLDDKRVIAGPDCIRTNATMLAPSVAACGALCDADELMIFHSDDPLSAGENHTHWYSNISYQAWSYQDIDSIHGNFTGRTPTHMCEGFSWNVNDQTCELFEGNRFGGHRRNVNESCDWNTDANWDVYLKNHRFAQKMKTLAEQNPPTNLHFDKDTYTARNSFTAPTYADDDAWCNTRTSTSSNGGDIAKCQRTGCTGVAAADRTNIHTPWLASGNINVVPGWSGNKLGADYCKHCHCGVAENSKVSSDLDANTGAFNTGSSSHFNGQNFGPEGRIKSCSSSEACGLPSRYAACTDADKPTCAYQNNFNGKSTIQVTHVSHSRNDNLPRRHSCTHNIFSGTCTCYCSTGSDVTDDGVKTKYSYNTGMVTGKITTSFLSSGFSSITEGYCKTVEQAFDFDPDDGIVHIKLSTGTDSDVEAAYFVRTSDVKTDTVNRWNSFKLCYASLARKNEEQGLGYLAWQGFKTQHRDTVQDVFHNISNANWRTNTAADTYDKTFSTNDEIPFHGAKGGTCTPSVAVGNKIKCCTPVNLNFDVYPTVVAAFDGDVSSRYIGVFVQTMQRVDYTAPEPYSGDRFESVDVTFCKQDDAAPNQAGITAGDIAYFAFNDLQSHNYVYFPDPVDHVTIAKYTRHGLNTTNMNYSINYDDTNTHRPLMKYLIHDRNTYTTSSAAHVLNPEQSGFRRSGIMQLKTATDCQPVSHDSDLIVFGTSVVPAAGAPCATWTDHRVGSLYGQTFICTSGVGTCGTANDRYSYIVTANTVTK